MRGNYRVVDHPPIVRSLNSHLHLLSFIPFAYLQEIYNYSFKKAFLSDSGTYPLIAVLATATFFIVGMSANGLMYYKNIRITPAHKHEVIQDWGTEHVDTVTKMLAKRPIAMYAQGFKDIQREGLGINHEEWKKGKEAYSRGE